MKKIYLTINNNRQFINMGKDYAEAYRMINTYIQEQNAFAVKHMDKPIIRNTVPCYLNSDQINDATQSGKVEECAYIQPIYVKQHRVSHDEIVCDMAYNYVYRLKGLTLDIDNPKNTETINFIDCGAATFEIVDTVSH